MKSEHGGKAWGRSCFCNNSCRSLWDRAKKQLRPRSRPVRSLWDRAKKQLRPRSGFTDIYYIAYKLIGRDATRRVLRMCLEGMQIVAVDERLLEQALSLTGPDFEDDLQMAAAAAAHLDAIVTRDASGFAGSPIPVLSPSELISKLGHA